MRAGDKFPLCTAAEGGRERPAGRAQGDEYDKTPLFCGPSSCGKHGRPRWVADRATILRHRAVRGRAAWPRPRQYPVWKIIEDQGTTLKWSL